MAEIIPDVISGGRATAHWASVWCCDGLFCRIRSAMILPFLRCFFQPRFCRWLIFFSQNAVKMLSHNSESIGISVFPLDSLSWHTYFACLCSQSPIRKCPCFWGGCGAQKMIGARPGWGWRKKGRVLRRTGTLYSSRSSLAHVGFKVYEAFFVKSARNTTKYRIE